MGGEASSVGIHELTENKRPGTNNLESRKGLEPSNIKRVSYANTNEK